MANSFSLKDFKRIYAELSTLPDDVLQSTAKDMALRLPAKVTKAVCSEFNIPRQIMIAAGKHAKTQAFSQATSPGHDYRDIVFKYSINELHYDVFKNAITPKAPPEGRSDVVVFPETVGAKKWAQKYGMKTPAFHVPKRYKIKAKTRKGRAEEVGPNMGGSYFYGPAFPKYHDADYRPFVGLRKGKPTIYRSVEVEDDHYVRVRMYSDLSLQDMVRDEKVFPQIQQEAGKLFAKRFEHNISRAQKKLGRR